jgi:hypothetical protein
LLQKIQGLVPGVGPQRAALALLGQKLPVDVLIREHQMGLQRFLEQGVTLDQFLQHGYKWSDLSLFQDLGARAVPERRQRAWISLGLEMRHLLQVPDLRARTADMGFAMPKDQVELLGGQFPDGGAFFSVPNTTASDLIALGWRAHDLYGAGLQYIEQYAALDPGDDDERALGMTQPMIDLLPSSKVAGAAPPPPAGSA